MEGGKDTGKSHSWVEGAEVEADRWVDTTDPAALDAWGREGSPGPRSAEAQGLGEENDLSASDRPSYHGRAEMGSLSNIHSSLQASVEVTCSQKQCLHPPALTMNASYLPYCA